MAFLVGRKKRENDLVNKHRSVTDLVLSKQIITEKKCLANLMKLSVKIIIITISICKISPSPVRDTVLCVLHISIL